MSNSLILLQHLHRRCFGCNGLCSRPSGGQHAQCIGKRAQRAAIFQEELCLTILRGLREQLIHDGRMFENEIGVMSQEDKLESADGSVPGDGLRPYHGRITKDPACQFRQHKGCALARSLKGDEAHGERHNFPRDPNTLRQILKVQWKGEQFVDDLTGLPLPPDLCRAARQKEIDYFKSKGVWELRTVNEARRRMGR